jgi:hypothetical protein
MISTLDGLSMVGTELTDAALEGTVGGCLILVAFAIGFGVGFVEAAVVDVLTS